jgi:hypothetical protein
MTATAAMRVATRMMVLLMIPHQVYENAPLPGPALTGT